MIERKLKINSDLEDSIFLFGARQTGKSTFLREKFKDCTYIDLLDTSVKTRFKRTPSLLYDILVEKPEGTLVIIDEVPEVPGIWKDNLSLLPYPICFYVFLSKNICLSVPEYVFLSE